MMKPKLKILDVSASIGCNLSCKGCNHFSNYFAAGSKINTDQLLNDLNKILPRIDIDRISVIGGEPLLNPRCEEILNACRSSSDSIVYLYTNGLLLLQNEEWIKKKLEDPKIFLRISVHIPEVIDIVKKFNHPKVIVSEHHNNVDQWFYSIKQRGGKVYPYDHKNPEKSFYYCSCPNTQLYNGRLWKCPNSAFLNELLYVTNQENDFVWNKYKKQGLPVDCSDHELKNFCDNSTNHESICNMCTSKPLKFSAAVQSKIKKKVIHV